MKKVIREKKTLLYVFLFLSSLLVINTKLPNLPLWYLIDGERSGGPAGLSAGQISRDGGAVCELWSRDSDPDKGGKLYDKDESGDSTLRCTVAAETRYTQKEPQ